MITNNPIWKKRKIFAFTILLVLFLIVLFIFVNFARGSFVT